MHIYRLDARRYAREREREREKKRKKQITRRAFRESKVCESSRVALVKLQFLADGDSRARARQRASIMHRTRSPPARGVVSSFFRGLAQAHRRAAKQRKRTSGRKLDERSAIGGNERRSRERERERSAKTYPRIRGSSAMIYRLLLDFTATIATTPLGQSPRHTGL